MAVPVKMPQMGLSEESCIIAKWNKKRGDIVKAGEILFTIETGKSTFDVEAEADGKILDVFFEEGDEVPVSTFVCVIGDEGENIDEFIPGKVKVLKGEETYIKKEVQEQAEVKEDSIFKAEAIAEVSGGRIKISPRARNAAEKSGVDYSYASPTGPEGRIIERDIISLVQNGPIVTSAARDNYMKLDANKVTSGTGLGGRITTKDLSISSMQAGEPALEVQLQEQQLYEEVKLSNMRKIIGNNMYESLSTTAQLTLNSSFDATEIMEFRRKVKDSKDKLGLENISLNDIILYAVSRTLLNHKDLNAHFMGDKMLIFNNVQLGVAVDTDRGLMVPTMNNANLKSLNEISSEMKNLIGECKKGSINPDYLKGASFTVTNLGSLGIESFTPVLNPPQTGILGVNNIVYRVKNVGGQFVNYPAMGLSLTFDHRAVDGAPAARFLKELADNLENFSMLLAK